MYTDLRTLIGYTRTERGDPTLASMQGDHPVLASKETDFFYEFILSEGTDWFCVLSLRKDLVERPDMTITNVTIRQRETGTLIEPFIGRGTTDTFLFRLGEQNAGASRFKRTRGADTFFALDPERTFRILHAFSLGKRTFVILDTITVGVVLKEIVSRKSFTVSPERLREHPEDYLFGFDPGNDFAEILIPIEPE